jgi:hypothetical protein
MSKNRIITHYDFDGIVSAMLLAEHYKLNSSNVIFAHPKDASTGVIVADQNTIVCDLPYFFNAGEWFDHHFYNFRDDITVDGKREEEKSCARIIARALDMEENYFTLLKETDKIDSAGLHLEDVLNPGGYVLLSCIVGSNYKSPEDIKFNRHLLDLLRINDIASALNDNYIGKIISDYQSYMELARPYIEDSIVSEGDVVVADLRSAPIGVRLQSIRYLPFALNPKLPLGVIMFRSPVDQEVCFDVGYSIFNRESNVDIGELMKSVGGGGHRFVGGTKVPAEKAEEVYATIVAGLNQ